MVRTSLCEYLGLFPEFAFVGMARDGLEALRLAQNTEMDVLLLDISMPHLTGLEVLRELRSRKSAVQVIMHSSYPAYEFQGTAIGLGASAYLEKGCAPERIVAAIRSAAGRPQ